VRVGRRRQYDEVASESISVRLTPEQRRELEQVARANETTLAGVMREAVNSFVADYRDDHPVFRRADRKAR
jgi:predicted DNA-binding protein